MMKNMKLNLPSIGITIFVLIVMLADILIAHASFFSIIFLLIGILSIPVYWLFYWKTKNPKYKNKTKFFLITLFIVIVTPVAAVIHNRLIINHANTMIEKYQAETTIHKLETYHGYQIKFIKTHGDVYIEIKLYNLFYKLYREGKWLPSEFGYVF